jgi:hypothetical protein
MVRSAGSRNDRELAGTVAMTLNLVGRFDSYGSLPTSGAGACVPRLAGNLQPASNLG